MDSAERRVISIRVARGGQTNIKHLMDSQNVVSCPNKNAFSDLPQNCSEKSRDYFV